MGREKKRPDESKEDLNIDFGIGKLSLGGLFKSIEKLVDLAGELKKTGEEGEIDLSHLRKGAKGIFGFSVKTAVGGKPVVEPFGNIKKTAKGPIFEEVREPITDVFDEKEEIRVYAEMPGVNEEDIKLDFSPSPEAGSPSAKKADILIVSARTGDRKYHKEILLPVKVKPEIAASGYKNGILEVKIKNIK